MNLGKWIMTSCTCKSKPHVCSLAVCASQLLKFCHTSTPTFSTSLSRLLLTYRVIDPHCGVKRSGILWTYLQKGSGWNPTLTVAMIKILQVICNYFSCNKYQKHYRSQNTKIGHWRLLSCASLRTTSPGRTGEWTCSSTHSWSASYLLDRRLLRPSESA